MVKEFKSAVPTDHSTSLLNEAKLSISGTSRISVFMVKGD